MFTHGNRGFSCTLAVDETVILLHPPLPLVGVSIAMERERQQNDILVNGYCTRGEVLQVCINPRMPGRVLRLQRDAGKL